MKIETDSEGVIVWGESGMTAVRRGASGGWVVNRQAWSEIEGYLPVERVGVASSFAEALEMAKASEKASV